MTFTESLTLALNRMIAFLPQLLAALIILAVGLLVAYGLGGLTRRLLHAVGTDRFAARHQLAPKRTTWRASNVGGRIVFWCLALVTFVAAADALQLPWVTTGLARVVAYLPNVLAAALIVIAGWVLGNVTYRALLRSENATAPLWGKIARAGIFALAGFMAVQQLNIAVQIVTLAFAFTLGALAIAAAVAFGIGNRELAARVTSDWYERNRAMRLERPTPSGEPLANEPLPEQPRH